MVCKTLLALWIARARLVKEAAGVCPLNMSTSEELSTTQELILVSALEDVVCMVSHE